MAALLGTDQPTPRIPGRGGELKRPGLCLDIEFRSIHVVGRDPVEKPMYVQLA